VVTVAAAAGAVGVPGPRYESKLGVRPNIAVAVVVIGECNGLPLKLVQVREHRRPCHACRESHACAQAHARQVECPHLHVGRMFYAALKDLAPEGMRREVKNVLAES
jgi:hypothetical protein